MEELIKYFESLEARIAGYEARIAALEAEVADLKNRPLPAAPQPEPEPEPEPAPEPVVEEQAPVAEAPAPAATEEVASPKAAIYGKAVDDIRQAISLGDRFLYQRELFGQNAELMQRTLTELNALRSFDEAMNYISRFDWDQESNSYQQFIVTLHRRFG